MSKIFTIQITSFRPPFMREKQRKENTVCKKYVGGKVVYHEFKWNNPKAGRNVMFFDTPETIAERTPYNETFAKQVQRAKQMRHAKQVWWDLKFILKLNSSGMAYGVDP